MSARTATISSPLAGRYMRQLCKHWSHKFDVKLDETRGEVAFPGARAVFVLEGEQLQLEIHAEDATLLDRMEGVVVEHLQRFAVNEQLDVRWLRDAD